MAKLFLTRLSLFVAGAITMVRWIEPLKKPIGEEGDDRAGVEEHQRRMVIRLPGGARGPRGLPLPAAWFCCVCWRLSSRSRLCSAATALRSSSVCSMNSSTLCDRPPSNFMLRLGRPCMMWMASEMRRRMKWWWLWWVQETVPAAHT